MPANDSGHLLLDTQDSDPSSKPGDTCIQMAELPPQWIDSAEEARADLKVIREKIGEVIKKQEKRLRKVFDADGAPDREVEALCSEIGSYMKRCEHSIHQVKARGVASSHTDQEFRVNVQRSLATQLQQLSQQFRTSQKDYLVKIQKRKTGGVWEDTSKTGGGFDSGFDQGQLLELEGMEQNADQRSQEIATIAQSINELHTIFKELAVLVIDQGTILDRIDYNIEQVVSSAKDAKDQLHIAEKASKSNRATKCMLILVVIDVILLIILIMKSRH
jgi:syntaxin 16